MSTVVTYKGSTVATVSNATGTLKTAGKYLDADVVLVDNSIVINNQNKTVSPTESSQSITADSGYTGLGTVTVNAISSNYIGSNIPRNTSANLTVNGATITTASGYYASAVSKAVATTTHPNPTTAFVSSTGTFTATHTQTTGYVTGGTTTSTLTLTTKSAATIVPTESSQTIASNQWLTGVQTIAAISSTYVGSGIPTKSSADLTVNGATITTPSGYYSSEVSKAVANGTAGTPAATKGTVSNHSVSVTPTVTNTTGYITGGTKTGTAVTVTASELVSGTLSISTNGVKDVTNYASVNVNVNTVNNQNKEVIPTESTQEITADDGYTGIGTVTVNAISNTYVGTSVARISSANVTVNGSAITSPSGYYASAITKNVVAGTATTPATTITTNPTIFVNTSTGVITASYTGSSNVTPTIVSGWITTGTSGKVTTTGTNTLSLTTQAAKTVTPTETEQNAVASNVYTIGVVKVGAISSDYVGSNVPKKSAADLTASGSTVTVPTGYYSSQVTKNIGGGTAATPAKTITTNPTITLSTTTGIITATYNGSSSITPTVTAGYISQGTAGTVSTTGTSTFNLTTQSATAITPTESAQTAVTAGKYTTGAITVNAIPSTYVGTGVTQRSSADLTASGSVVTTPAGYYASSASKNISGGTATTPATTITTNPTVTINSSTGVITANYTGSSNVTPTINAGYITAGTSGKITTTGSGTLSLTTKAAATITPTETTQTIASNQWLVGVQTIAAISSTYVGSGVPQKSAADLTVNGATVTTPIGYYSSAVSKAVATTTHPNPTLTLTSSTGVINASHVQGTGYVTGGTTTSSLTLTTKAASTYTPGTTNQTIASNQWLTGVQTIAGDSDLVAGNIKTGVQIFGVTGTFTSDATASASDIVSGKTAYVSGSKITGNLSFITYYTGSTTPASTLGSNGDIYLQS